MKKQILEVQKPVAFEGRASYRKNVEEAKSKYKTITNSDELVRAFIDAQQRGDKFDQVAILEKISGDGNLNEVLNQQGYASNAKGLYQFVDGHQNKKGDGKPLEGFSEHQRLNILNDLGESEERVGHWEMAKMSAMNSKGEMESTVKPIRDSSGKIVDYDDTRHAIPAFAEIQKMDPQQAVNRLNRLAYGGEDADGNFILSNLGKMIFKAFAEGGAYQKHTGRIQSNAASNLISPGTLPILRQILYNDQQTSKNVISALQSRGEGSGGVSFRVSDMHAWLEKFNRDNKNL